MIIKNGFVFNSPTSSFLILTVEEENEEIILNSEFYNPSNEDLEDFIYDVHMSICFERLSQKGLNRKGDFHEVMKIYASDGIKTKKRTKEILEKIVKQFHPYIVNIDRNRNEELWNIINELRQKDVRILKRD